MKRRDFLRCIAIATAVPFSGPSKAKGAKPWARLAETDRPIAWMEGALYRYVRFETNVEPGDLVVNQSGNPLGVANYKARRRETGWVQISGPAMIKLRHGV